MHSQPYIGVFFFHKCTITSVSFFFFFFFFIFRGKGDYFRLGHGTDSHVRKPQLVEGLKGKKIVDVAVGALHCLAVTEEGQVRQMAINGLCNLELF